MFVLTTLYKTTQESTDPNMGLYLGIMLIAILGYILHLVIKEGTKK